MAKRDSQDPTLPSIRSLKGRLEAIQDGYRFAVRHLGGEEQSKELRQWIKLAHEVTERRDLEKQARKLIAAMERERVAAERGEMGASQGDGEGEGTDIQ